MKGFIKLVVQFILVLFIFVIIIQGIFLVVGPDYKNGEYTMTYKVYYPDNPKTYTIKNEWPISTKSSRGTNRVIKIIKVPYMKNMFDSSIVFESSAPIEVVNYTFKEK